MARKTPTPRYIAAKLLQNFDEAAYFRTTADLSSMFESRVSEDKREKAMKVVGSLAAGLKRRLKKIIDRFESPPPRKPKKETSRDA